MTTPAEMREAPAGTPTTTPAATPAAIEIRGLRRYYGQVRAVDGVDLTIAPGEVVALLGPNGAGKSTTIDTILGLTAPQDGTVRIFGRTPQEALRDGSIGAMLQDGEMVQDVTVRELLTMFASLYRRSLTPDEVMRRVGITELADRRGRLSGGERQRVRLAVALLPDPQLLVLDEPTVAMDVTARRAFWSSMHDFVGRGHTVLFATHYLKEAEEFSDRVVLMRAGTVVADGSVTEVRKVAGGRVLTADVPGADLDRLARLDGVLTASLGTTGRVELACADSDRAVQALFAAYPDAHDVEIGSMGLEQAFLVLTGTEGVPAR